MLVAERSNYVAKCRSAAELLGFEVYMKPFTTVSGDEILQGVNYASGAAGILDQTGMQSVKLFILDDLDCGLSFFD